jgi:hypothetical protein
VQRVVTSLLRTAAAGAVGGALCGLAVGALLGRLAMRLLAATSPSAVGVVTDDGAVVGTISVDGTLLLAAFVARVGGAAGLLYVLARRVLPPSRAGRAAGFGLLAATLGGAAVVHGYGSVDFTALSPVWLAVVLFVALPLGFGLLAPVVVDALDGGWARRAPPWLLTAAAVAALLSPALLIPAAVGLGIAIAVATTDRLGRIWRSRAVTVAGRVLFVALVGWGGYGLAVDVTSLVEERPVTAFVP